MAVILEERGRGKFKPAPDYKVDEVKELLNKKIVAIFGMRWSGFGL